MKKLIINADGYGFFYGANRAIEETVQAGIVTSISVNVNFPAAQELPEFLKRYPHISVAVHLNPIAGYPVSPIQEVPSLVNGDGEFYGPEFTNRLQSGLINLSELELELSRQVELGKQLAGSSLTHIDSQENRHLYPRYFKVFIRIAKKYGIERMRTHSHFICAETANPRKSAIRYYLNDPVRIVTHLFARYEMWLARRSGMRMADRLMSVGWIDGANKTLMQSWKNILENVPEGISEVYCHPAYVDDVLRKYATYVDEREKERAVLTSPEIKQAIQEKGIKLTSFYDI
jgi:predicted glycoside hydrolase/deacetylase ChbG (UPF0249 family)